MSNITLRLGKGSPLTNAEVDANFTNLNTDKVESITSADGSVIVSGSGTTRDLSVGTAANTGTLISQIRNETGAALTKGTVVYISGASGNKALVSKALASGDTTSAQTYGMVQADIPNNQNGYVVVIGAVRGLDTSAFPDGTQLYLSGVTAGTYTSTKPYAPLHLVYVGIVTYSHANQGAIEVKIQNGYEMDELHDVSAQSPTDGQMLVYNSTTGLWTKSNAPTITGGTINNTVIGGTTPAAGTFTTLNATGQSDLGLNGSNNQTFRATAGTGAFPWVQSTHASGNARLRAVSTTGNVDFWLSSTGTGAVKFFTNANTDEQFRVSHTASAVNYVQVTGAATANDPVISVQGSDTDRNLKLTPKGTGQILSTSSFVAHSNAYNSLRLSGGDTTGFSPRIQSQGSDTNISQVFQSKGTGAIDLAAGSSGVNISNGGTVTAITRTAGGSAYTSIPTVAITAPTTSGGVQATASVGSMFTNTATVQSGGTGYTNGDVLTIVGGTVITSAATYTVTGVSGGAVTSVTPLNFNQYSVLPTNPVSTTGGTGSGATLNLTYGIGTVAFTITNAGSGYVEQPTITFSGGGGSGAAAYASVGSLPIIRSLVGSGSGSASLSFYTASGEAVRITDGGGPSVNYWRIQGSPTNSGVQFQATGSDTNVSGLISSKGTSGLGFYTNTFGQQQFQISHTASAVNYVQVTGAATGARPTISAQGSDAAVDLNFAAKGIGGIYFQQFSVFGSGKFNNWTADGAVTGLSPFLRAGGGDTNVSATFGAKGTGAINLAPGSSGVNISNGGTVTAVTRTATGSGYTSAPALAISAPTTAGGVQATATCTIATTSASTISSGGTGYTVGDTLTAVGGTFSVAASWIVASVSGGVITGLTLNNGGQYTTFPTNPVALSGGTGTGAAVNFVGGLLSSFFTITNAGSGYVEQPTVTFSGGGGSGAAAYATVGSGTTVKSIGSTMSFSTPVGEGFRVLEYFPSGTSANYIFAAGRAASNPPVFGAAGSDTNISLAITSKGTGGIAFTTSNGGLNQFQVAHTASAVNYVQVTGAATAGLPQISAQGSDTNINILYTTKGTGEHRFSTAASTSSIQFRVRHINSAANYCAVIGAPAGSTPEYQTLGTDTNIDLALTPKGTGVVKVGTNTVLHAGNYNTYAPTLTGTGASGSWGISVTGSAGSVAWSGVTGTPTTLSGYGITDAQATLVSGTSIKTVNGVSVLGSGNIQIDGGVTSFNTRTGAVTLSSGDVTTALGFTPYNATNPSGYITSSALSGYLTSASAASTYLPLSGGTMTGSIVNNQNGGVIIESNLSEANNWLWKEAVKQWGIYWFNTGSQSGQTIGTYTTIGAETMFMGGANGIAMPTGWTGYQSGSYIAAMISSYTGYIYSASTVYAASSMLVGGSTVLHAGNYGSYALPLSGGTVAGPVTITGNDNQLIIDATSGPTAGIFLKHSGVNKWEIYNSSNSFGLYNYSSGQNELTVSAATGIANFRNTPTAGGNSILHAGNYTNYVQLPYAGWDSYPGKDANTVVAGSWMRSYFTYSNNAPLTGALVHFPAGGYDLQLNGSYGDGGGRLAFRNRNGDNGTFLPWREILHANNYTSYSPSLTGSGASGTWGISITGSAASLGGVDASNYFRSDGTYPNDDMNTPVEGYWHVRSYATGLPEGYYGHRWDYDHLNNGQWVFQMYSPTGGDPGLWFRQRRDYSWQTWRKVLDSSNYSSYALPLSGGTLSGGLTVNNATINVPSGYVSNGNPWGTSNSAFFPNGITTNNVTNWIYGYCYLGNAPTNGSGAEVQANGRFYNTVSSGTAMHVRRTGSAGTATDSYTALFEQTYGDHSWGIVAEFRAGGSGGSDRPSILFSNGYNSTTWSVGFGAADDQFRINQNHGHRNGGWGSERFRIDTGSTAYFNGNVAIHAANVSSYALPIGGGTLTSSTKIKAGHGDTRFQLHYNHDNADTTSGYAGYLTLWASEPGLSYAYTGIGGNINIGGNYYGRQTSGQAYGLYLRFETASGFSEFWATTGAVGSAGGQGSRVAYIDAAGNSVFSGNVTAYSDERLKKDWVALPADFIARLATVKSGTYTRVDSGARQAGSSAQDWKTLLPEVVSASNDEAQTLSLAYGNAALVSAVELAKDNVELRARIERLESLINKLIGD